MAERIITVMAGVREYAEDFPVQLCVNDDGRLCIRARNEGGHNVTEVDLADVLDWVASKEGSQVLASQDPIYIFDAPERKMSSGSRQAGTENEIEVSSGVVSWGVSLLLSSGLLKPEAEEREQVLAELVGEILRGAKTPGRS